MVLLLPSDIQLLGVRSVWYFHRNQIHGSLSWLTPGKTENQIHLSIREPQITWTYIWFAVLSRINENSGLITYNDWIFTGPILNLYSIQHIDVSFYFSRNNFVIFGSNISGITYLYHYLCIYYGSWLTNVLDELCIKYKH